MHVAEPVPANQLGTAIGTILPTHMDMLVLRKNVPAATTTGHLAG